MLRQIDDVFWKPITQGYQFVVPEVIRQSIRRVFVNHGERVNGRPVIPSKRKLREALQAEKLASGNAQGDQMVRSIVSDYCAPETAHMWGEDRPIVTSDGPKKATVFTWRMVEPEQPNDA